MERIFERVRETIPDLARSELRLPDALPVIQSLNVAAEGRLYVYPHTVRDPDDPPERFPVDVYDRDGERLFTGTIDRGRWYDSVGDAYYAAITGPVSSEFRVVRRRQVAPFTPE